jgi:hypothetical protein
MDGRAELMSNKILPCRNKPGFFGNLSLRRHTSRPAYQDYLQRFIQYQQQQQAAPYRAALYQHRRPYYGASPILVPKWWDSILSLALVSSISPEFRHYDGSLTVQALHNLDVEDGSVDDYVAQGQKRPAIPYQTKSLLPSAWTTVGTVGITADTVRVDRNAIVCWADKGCYLEESQQ